MQERWAATGSRCTMHSGWAHTPGVVTSLPGFHRLMPPILRDAETGADTIVWLAATDPTPGGGQFWNDRAPRPEHYLRRTRESREDLEKIWAHVLDPTGLA